MWKSFISIWRTSCIAVPFGKSGARLNRLRTKSEPSKRPLSFATTARTAICRMSTITKRANNDSKAKAVVKGVIKREPRNARTV